jgi:hypothetical protein
VLVGGDDLDRRIMGSLLKYFGEDPERGESLPLDIASALESWQSMPDLSYPHFHDVFNQLRRSHKRPKTIDALQTLVSKNVGYSLFREIERVKRELTSKNSAELLFRYENIQIDEKISRARFENLIRREIEAADEGIRQVLHDANTTPAQIDTVVRTGGSSLVPAFIDLLARHFGEEKLVEIDPLLSVAGGLGILAHENLGRAGVYCPKYVRQPERVIADVRAATSAEVFLMRVGERAYTDRDTTVRKLPVALSALPAIRVPHVERELTREDYLRFTLTGRAKVCVAYAGMTSSIPHWLRGFTLQPMRVEVNDEWWGTKELAVYSQWFDAGEVTLGASSADGVSGRVDVNMLVIIEPEKHIG